MGLLDKVTMEPLSGESREIAELIGLEHFKKIVKTYSGASFYVPKIDSVVKGVRDEQIRKEFTGGNIHELALKYGITDKWVREIVSGDDDEDIPGQMSIFDMNIEEEK